LCDLMYDASGLVYSSGKWRDWDLGGAPSHMHPSSFLSISYLTPTLASYSVYSGPGRLSAPPPFNNRLSLAEHYVSDSVALKNPRYHTSYITMHERGSQLSFDVDHKTLLYDGVPALSFHFSGHKTHLPDHLSSNQNRYNLAHFPALRPMFEFWREELARFSSAYEKETILLSSNPSQNVTYIRTLGDSRLRGGPPQPFSHFSNGIRITTEIKNFYWALSQKQRDVLFWDPFYAGSPRLNVSLGQNPPPPPPPLPPPLPLLPLAAASCSPISAIHMQRRDAMRIASSWGGGARPAISIYWCKKTSRWVRVVAASVRKKRASRFPVVQFGQGKKKELKIKRMRNIRGKKERRKEGESKKKRWVGGTCAVTTMEGRFGSEYASAHFRSPNINCTAPTALVFIM
jgi:hypothetical protein